MTQTLTRDPSVHGSDKHNWDKHNSDQHKWDENALGNSEAVVKQQNGEITRRVIWGRKIRHKKNRLNSKSGD